MADPINSAFQQELLAALVTLDSEVRGLTGLAAMPSSGPLLDDIHALIATHSRRRAMIVSMLASMDSAQVERDALERDGYPAVPHLVVATDLIAELRGDTEDIAHATALFDERPLAASMAIDLGAPTKKPPETE